MGLGSDLPQVLDPYTTYCFPLLQERCYPPAPEHLCWILTVHMNSVPLFIYLIQREREVAATDVGTRKGRGGGGC